MAPKTLNAVMGKGGLGILWDEIARDSGMDRIHGKMGSCLRFPDAHMSLIDLVNHTENPNFIIWLSL